jgi:hypothetical protein
MFEGMDEIPACVDVDAATERAASHGLGRMGIPDEQGAWEAFIERHPLADF